MCPINYPYLRSFIVFGFLLAGVFGAHAQSVYAPLNSDYYHLVERYEIKSGKFAEGMHTQIRPVLRQAIVQLTDTVVQNNNFLSDRDRFNLTYLRNDSWEWAGDSADSDSRKPILKHFYKKKSDLFSYQDEDFDLHINPVIYFAGGGESGTKSGNYFTNTRGLELRGMISKKIGFYTFIADNQSTFPTYVQDLMNQYYAVPQEGYWKLWKSGDKGGRDFLTARGYITFHVAKPIMIQFGQDKNVIGSGYRSLVLSDFAGAYPFLKINTKVWKLNYMNLYAQMTADTPPGARDYLRSKKYFAFHHLSINLTRNLNVGVFESIMFGRPDDRRRFRYDFHYYNPIIFYRYVEQQLGSDDNAGLGMDFKWNIKRHVQLYGQVMLDEFLLSHVRARDGWWGNKQAIQLGAKYIDVLNIRNLDLQTELNIVRPYTYTHTLTKVQNSPGSTDSSMVSFTNYVHNNLPLAHPLGANFVEWIGILRYQPVKRLQLTGKLIITKYGADQANGDGTTTNWGGNIRLDYDTHEKEYGNTIGQGVRTNIVFADMTASYMIKHNLFVDGKLTIRRLDSALPERNLNSVIAYLNLRWNIPQRLQEY
ncbi:hypothetical protein QNI19_23390 [Cytophagaceae bacterium DM2B3-1]|uniref:Gliding motility protein RemB n=1 Tax=Xanthocytophaga flava TaxID=3048013 RepID=A0ABT7CQ78_9BACT|nr:hypothetical protein [Xanthocytophaga flavus]MDJ1495898.1 hypothetical protein [Xanthocytophaga flavus]